MKDPSELKIKILPKVKSEQFEKEVVDFVMKCESDNTPISGDLIKAKGITVAETLGVDIKCSNGWLDSFKRRNGLK